jgi:hypothetical protein
VYLQLERLNNLGYPFSCHQRYTSAKAHLISMPLISNFVLAVQLLLQHSKKYRRKDSKTSQQATCYGLVLLAPQKKLPIVVLQRLVLELCNAGGSYRDTFKGDRRFSRSWDPNIVRVCYKQFGVTGVPQNSHCQKKRLTVRRSSMSKAAVPK